ncbi:unnamed protein product [Rotaria sp. Silwood1]|nr:unnamed protein product [Rotaria sp. Silwood1]
MWIRFTNFACLSYCLYEKLTELAKPEHGLTGTIVGHLISINMIKSTSHNDNIARGFIVTAEIGVIFKINSSYAHNS